MLKDHLETCVVEAVKNDDSQRVMTELWQLLRRGAEEEALASSTSADNSSGCCQK